MGSEGTPDVEWSKCAGVWRADKYASGVVERVPCRESSTEVNEAV